ncbi:hypothetical protein GO755_26525 [Spirosoma sp. HMF4905]|uniref:Uncharacterized protein n=1 Tax=Spirosoma arboris TaxID=2682092 RepID=A0A7K1SIJ8_9BACT|nr:hypothetical protein [Spirosoma arboris]MVM33622.1 hypothetical protein [Spirosoma arboris]
MSIRLTRGPPACPCFFTRKNPDLAGYYAPGSSLMAGQTGILIGFDYQPSKAYKNLVTHELPRCAQA